MKENGSLVQTQQSLDKKQQIITPTSVLEIKTQHTLGKNQNKELGQYGIFESHQQKIQATYNFQSLFRKKSHLYTMHKNKKKPINKNNKNEQIKVEDGEKQQKNLKRGHWSFEENKKYHWFLELHNNHFINKHMRRTDKIFKTMSSFIATRQAQQCRSHHQKMQKKYKNFYKIIKKLRMDHYDTYNTDHLQLQLEKNGLFAQKDNLLIQHSKLIQLDNQQNGNESQELQNQQMMAQHQKVLQNGLANQSHNEQPYQVESMKQKEGDMFFGQNYEKQLNFKLY